MSHDPPHGRQQPDQLERALAQAWTCQPDRARTAAARAEALVAFGAAQPRRRRRWLAVAATATALAAGGTAAAAVTPGAVPGDAAYPLKQLGERLRVAVAGSASAEAMVWIDLADERLEEAVRVSDRPESLNEVLEGYETALRRGQEASADAGSPEVEDMMTRRVGVHLQVLRTLRGTAPEASTAALERALTAAAAGLDPDFSPGTGPGRSPGSTGSSSPAPPVPGSTRTGAGDGAGAPVPAAPTPVPGGAATGGRPHPAPDGATGPPGSGSPVPTPPAGVPDTHPTSSSTGGGDHGPPAAPPSSGGSPGGRP